MNAKPMMIQPEQSDETEDSPEAVVTIHPMADRAENLRVVEAMLFNAAEPLALEAFKEFLPEGTNIEALLADLAENYEKRGVNLVQVSGKFALRTAPDMGSLFRKEKTEQKKLTKAALETLAIIAYHQPVTRAEIEDIRGVAISKGTLDNLLEIGWAKMRGRRKTPGRPVTYGTTEAFLGHFGLNELTDLPGLQELKAAGLLDANVPPGFDVPMPKLTDELTADEDPLDGNEQMPLEMHLPEEGAEPEELPADETPPHTEN
ncbi:SMC-Scp complex subunit ScpB [Aestuariivirga litoralis]|uniref:SMC-Scp complex subunit ScpB n=1 Tax=Aestuariivirga litoralis TaxID=2650924 RepID=UPI001FEE336B|nr:SMC-Scp complex subunit ScpB [Aestuariivirga litoralis]